MTYIKFANQTYAQKAASLLNKRSIKTRIRRNPNPNHKEGCNYALFVSGDIFEFQLQPLAPRIVLQRIVVTAM